MNELFLILNNLRSLRKETRELTLEQLQDALSKFQQVVQEVEAEEKSLNKVNKEKQDKIELYRQLLLDDGITPEELLNLVQNKAPKGKRKPLAAKYKYVDGAGVEKTWTGQGRTPSVIQDALNAGTALTSFLI